MAESCDNQAPSNTGGNEATGSAASTEKVKTEEESGYVWPVEDAGKWFEDTVAKNKLTVLVYFRGHW